MYIQSYFADMPWRTGCLDLNPPEKAPCLQLVPSVARLANSHEQRCSHALELPDIVCHLQGMMRLDGSYAVHLSEQESRGSQCCNWTRMSLQGVIA